MLKTVVLSEKITEKEVKTFPCAFLLGGFDGLHAGHKTLVARAARFRLPVGILTIDGGKGEENLFTLAEREHIFRSAGIDFALEASFQEIKSLSAEAFAELLVQTCNPASFVCGEDFRFGAGALGTAETIERVTRVPVEKQKLVLSDGRKTSARTVKEALTKGDVETAARVLGERYFLLGEVIADRGVGKTLGFPTANAVYPKRKFPLKKGVYETEIVYGGKRYKGITNYGARPTFDEQRVVTETHLIGFDGELYGETLEIRFVRFLRDICKFESAEALKEQLTKDVRRVNAP